jgi:hypothetical protein
MTLRNADGHSLALAGRVAAAADLALDGAYNLASSAEGGR